MIRSNNGGGKNNNFILTIAILGLLLVFGIYCIWGKSKPEEYSKRPKTKESNNDGIIINESKKENVEYIQQADSEILEEYTGRPDTDDIEIIDNEDDPPPNKGFDYGGQNGIVSYL